MLVGVLVVGFMRSREPDALWLSGETLHGERTFKGDRFVLVEGTRVSAGATVTLQAGEVVAFGEGFSVDVSASLAVVVGEVNGS